MVEVLTGLLIALVVVLCFGNGLLYFGEDKNSPIMKTLASVLIILFIMCVGITFSI